MTFDPTKPVQTRDGRPTRILCTDRKHPDYPIVALVTWENGQETTQTFRADGSFLGCAHDPAHDLVNVHERVSRWMNAYSGQYVGDLYMTRESCHDSACTSGLAAVVEFIFEGDRLVDVKLHPVEG